VLDRGREQRVVRAAEDERVDVRFLQLLEVTLGDLDRLDDGRLAAFGQVDEVRTRLREDLEGLSRADESLLVLTGADRRLGMTARATVSPPSPESKMPIG
jgi:hypothetical protein